MFRAVDDSDPSVATGIDRSDDDRRMDRAQNQLDDTDRSIVEHLQRDGRMPYTRLGAAVGLSEAAARQRVQRLIDTGVVQIVAVTNPMSIGYRRMAMIGVRTEGPTQEITATLQSMKDIDYLVITAGSYDFLCEVVVGDDRDLLDLTNRIRAVEGVVSTETFIYLDLAKQTFTWGAH
jgi:Lrp/AsnC family transcriptional regulator, regulator for asnA, asnC and gidA